MGVWARRFSYSGTVCSGWPAQAGASERGRLQSLGKGCLPADGAPGHVQVPCLTASLFCGCMSPACCLCCPCAARGSACHLHVILISSVCRAVIQVAISTVVLVFGRWVPRTSLWLADSVSPDLVLSTGRARPCSIFRGTEDDAEDSSCWPSLEARE